MAIGKIERVPLREVWRHEAHDFTQWLENNIEVLNDCTDLNLTNVSREQSAGSFNVDLVAEDENGGAVVIENQLERSDHDHLGKLITYLSMMDARAGVWLVSDPRPEHVSAVSWLNESSSADFYLLKLEAIRIGDSPAAPLLTPIVKPTEEARAVGKTKKDMAESRVLMNRWWSGHIERSATRTKLHAHITPSTVGWISTSSGVPGLAWIYTVSKNGTGVELYIDRGKDSQEENGQIFDQIVARKDEVEAAYGGPLDWERLEARRACRIRVRFEHGGYRSPEEEWPALQDEAIDAMVRFEAALRPVLGNLGSET